MSDQHDIGWLKAQVETVHDKIDSHVRWEEGYHKAQEAELRSRFDRIEGKLDSLADVLAQAHTIGRFMRLVGYSVLAVLAFKFGDVSRLWKDW